MYIWSWNLYTFKINYVKTNYTYKVVWKKITFFKRRDVLLVTVYFLVVNSVCAIICMFFDTLNLTLYSSSFYLNYVFLPKLPFVFLLFRSSRPGVFCKKGVLRNFAKFTGKHLCQRLFFNKVAGLGLQLF